MLKQKGFVVLIFLIYFFGFMFSIYNFAQKIVPENQVLNTKNKVNSKDVASSPHSIKEKMGVYVFLGWMWISIVVLLYIIRQKVKEEDRLYQLKFFSDEKMDNL